MDGTAKNLLSEQPIDLVEWTYQKLLQMIAEGQLVPGEQIRQVQLADNLGVSRTPLIKALQQLTNENYLEHIPRKGFLVRQYSAEEMIRLHRIREACEGVAAYDACERASDEQIEGLYQIFAPFINVTEWTDEVMEEYLKADIKFHNAIVQLADNQFLAQVLKCTGFLLLTYQRGLLQHPSVTLKAHLEIIESLRQRDPERTQQLFERHLRTGRDNIRKIFK